MPQILTNISATLKSLPAKMSLPCLMKNCFQNFQFYPPSLFLTQCNECRRFRREVSMSTLWQDFQAVMSFEEIWKNTHKHRAIMLFLFCVVTRYLNVLMLRRLMKKHTLKNFFLVALPGIKKILEPAAWRSTRRHTQVKGKVTQILLISVICGSIEEASQMIVY